MTVNSPSNHGGPRRGMRPDDLYRLRWVSDPQLSPDGRMVAFVVTTLDEAEDDYRSAIWTVPVAGGEPRPFTTGSGRDTSPRWSPDGRSLAFVAQREGEKGQVYVIPTDGGEARRLTSAKLGVSTPVWSPDSTALCFTAKELLTEEPEPGNKKASPPRIITSAKYKLNAEGFTYDKRRHLYLVTVGGESRQLTDGDYSDESPTWSSDGTRIAFVSARHVDRDYDNVNDLFVLQVASGEVTQVTDGSLSVASPSWHPDGRAIAFLGNTQPNNGPWHARLWLVDPLDAPVQAAIPLCLTSDLDLNLAAGEPAWSADGSWLYVLAYERGTVPLLRINASTGTSETVAGGERSLSGFSLGRSMLIFAASRSDAPADLILLEANGERRLTDLNREFLDEVQLARPQRLTVSSPDGTVTDAWLMRPVGYAPGEGHPLLLNIHGGPLAQYGEAFLDEFQVQAGAGFGVLFGNYRGSTGYAEAFARTIKGESCLKETMDVLASLDHTLATCADIDSARLGVLGGSYGGYLTSWIIGQTDRFAAACSERAINNRLSKAGTDDLATHRTYFLDEPWRNPDLFLRLSPLMYVEKMVTPVLIVHSEEDLRCPVEQAEQLFIALKRLRRDVVFVRFPGENHELSRAGKPSHRVERLRIQLDFWQTRINMWTPGGEARAEAAVAG